MSDDRCDHAIKVLQAFMREMYRWDVKYYELLVNAHEANKGTAKQEISEIYNSYLTKKDRKLGREVALNASSPPEYDPDTEIIEKCEDVDEKKLLIYTKQTTGFKFECRYTLKNIQDTWRIDKRERYSVGKNKWVIETF
ncbi:MULTISPECIES: NTF2 fold immunity protein [Methylomonas]|nr:NTF2 fold immunity protein [Methylomonas methanica]TCV77525.1 NTF2 fold immunity protein of polymorphic toxin system component [Methylomonas methanica]